jgi:hypothetical protein
MLCLTVASSEAVEISDAPIFIGRLIQYAEIFIANGSGLISTGMNGTIYEKTYLSFSDRPQTRASSSCGSMSGAGTGCVRYCETGTSRYTGSLIKASAEINCAGSALPCSIAHTTSQTMTITFGLTLGISAGGLTAGVYFSVANAQMTQNAYTVNVPVGKKGYIGFYPTMAHSNGNVEAYYTATVNQGSIQLNVCSSSLNASSNGRAIAYTKISGTNESDGVYQLILT